MGTVAGFEVLRVQYARVAGKHAPIHNMYVRPHHGAETDALPGGRTLFVVNLPPDATRGTLRDLFRRAGAVESIAVHDFRARKEATDEDADEDEDDEDDTFDAEPAARTERGKPGKNAPPRVHPLPALAPHALLTTGSSAHIVFLDSSSLERAMQLPARSASKPYAWPQPGKERPHDESDDEGASRKPRRPAHTHADTLVGLPFLLERYRMLRPDHAQVKRHVDSAIARHTWIREHPQWLLEQRMAGDKTTSAGVGIEGVSVGPDGELLDADGFTIVQKGNKYGRSGGDENTFAAITPEFEEMLRQQPEKKKSKELTDFYRFQFREKKRQQFAALRAQFEADKQKIAQRKATMRFKPY
ncbi:hypothetical protein MOBT1_001730 [Malassezia obtusa]|uniref:Ribosomal RNA-processing protein 7 n=1 Tax=Malassezia obtusa TaxID=76774 RepID=A0AAF0E0G5_9BASI|nr:hypothetical protein MOBT1_001730 [Malassezia obtusa]